MSGSATLGKDYGGGNRGGIVIGFGCWRSTPLPLMFQLFSFLGFQGGSP